MSMKRGHPENYQKSNARLVAVELNDERQESHDS